STDNRSGTYGVGTPIGEAWPTGAASPRTTSTTCTSRCSDKGQLPPGGTVVLLEEEPHSGDHAHPCRPHPRPRSSLVATTGHHAHHTYHWCGPPRVTTKGTASPKVHHVPARAGISSPKQRTILSGPSSRSCYGKRFFRPVQHESMTIHLVGPDLPGTSHLLAGYDALVPTLVLRAAPARTRSRGRYLPGVPGPPAHGEEQPPPLHGTTEKAFRT